MKRILITAILLSLLLSGCESWTDGSYYHVTPHKIGVEQSSSGDVTVNNYQELLSAMENLVRSGMEQGIFYVPKYDQEQLSRNVQSAVRFTMNETPIGAYAVEDIQWELGSSGGQKALAVDVTYHRDRQELRNIRRVNTLEEARKAIFSALDACDSGVVLYIESYEETDLVQLVDDYSDTNPQSVMENPQVVASVYPQSGTSRVVELKFNYQNSREALRNMQTQVSPVFAAAALYVSGDSSDTEKLSQLYAFLMERYDYRFETSITPAYSLLRHGVGDYKAFAMVYAAMCRQAGIDCMVVTGTRAGEPWCWNLVRDGDTYYHVDLLGCSDKGEFEELLDKDMGGYVWDYSAYPESVLPEPDGTEPTGTESTGPTETPETP